MEEAPAGARAARRHVCSFPPSGGALRYSDCMAKTAQDSTDPAAQGGVPPPPGRCARAQTPPRRRLMLSQRNEYITPSEISL